MPAQVVVNIIVGTAGVIPLAIAFTLVYRVSGAMNLAFAAYYTAGAYLVYFFAQALGMRLCLAVVLAICSTAIMGATLEWAVFQPLRARGTSALAVLIASMGVYLVLEGGMVLAFGNDTKSLEIPSSASMLLLGGRITRVQLVMTTVVLSVTAALAWASKVMKVGLKMRAVANDRELAVIVGVNSQWLIFAAAVTAAALAALGGIFAAIDTYATPVMGFKAFIAASVAALVVGCRSIGAVVFGVAFVISAENFVALKLSSQWQDAILFLILIAGLIFRPGGIVTDGRTIRSV